MSTCIARRKVNDTPQVECKTSPFKLHEMCEHRALNLLHGSGHLYLPVQNDHQISDIVAPLFPSSAE